MLRVFSKTAQSTVRSAFTPITHSTIIPKATMATGKKENHDLTSKALFDVSHVTAIVTGGATGIGLMITQALVANGKL